MNQLTDILYKLLFHRSYRRRFLLGGANALHLDPKYTVHLATIDHQELDSAARKICANILHGNHTSEVGLMKTYPQTFKELEAIGHLAYDVIYSFMESSHFNAYCEVPYTGLGISIEEAFALFVQDLLDKSTASDLACIILHHEFLSAALAILTVNKNPSQKIQSNRIKQWKNNSFAVETLPSEVLGKTGAPVQMLYAATARGFVRGPISCSLGDSLAKLTKGHSYKDLPEKDVSMLTHLGFIDIS